LIPSRLFFPGRCFFPYGAVFFWILLSLLFGHGGHAGFVGFFVPPEISFFLGSASVFSGNGRARVRCHVLSFLVRRDRYRPGNLDLLHDSFELTPLCLGLGSQPASLSFRDPALVAGRDDLLLPPLCPIFFWQIICLFLPYCL